MKALVVGGVGFVGNELTEQLLSRGDEVCVFVHSEPASKSLDYVKGDITNAETLNKTLKGRQFDVIFHVASLPGDTGNPHQMMDVNVTGLLNMLEWARANPVKRYVLSSSISAMEWYPATKFNAPDYMPVDENHPCRPKDMYCTTKRMQELLALTYYHQYQVPTTISRLTAVVGPGGKGGGRGWREFAEKLQEGKKVQIPHFAPEELCHYVDIRDVARQQIAQAEHPKAIGEIFNCCATDPTRGADFINIVKKSVPGIKVDCGFAWSMAQGKEISFSMKKAKKLLGYEPKYSLENAIVSIKQWVDSGQLDTNSNDAKKYGEGVNHN